MRVREVAIVSMGPESREDRDVGLPGHEQDESRQRPGETGEDDPAEVAAGTDSGLDDADALPEHEDDSRRATDTASGEQNP